MAKKNKRIVSWGIGLVVVAAIGGFAYHRYTGDGATKVTYHTQPVGLGRISSTVTATGTLSPLNTVQVGSQVSGRILELFADFNSQVHKGQVVAKIDPSIIESNVAKAKANLQSSRAAVTKAEASLEDAEQKYERSKALADKKLVAAADVETARATYKSAQAQLVAARADLSQSKAALDQAKVNLEYTTIVSPIDGTVISRDVDVGQTVAASLQAPTLFTIAEDLRKMELHTSVAESDVGKLREGMDVTFTVDAFPETQFRGVVKQIRNSPQTEQNVVTYDAVVSVENDALKLRPGMTANVTYIVARKRGVIVVPNAALRFNPPASELAHLTEQEKAVVASVAGGGRGGRSGGSGRWSGGAGGRSGGAGGAGGRPGGASGAAHGGGGAPAAKPVEGDAADGKPARATDGGSADEPAGERAGGGQRSGRPARDPNARVAWVLVDGKPHPVKVDIGITDGSSTEITGGDLKEGAELIISSNGGSAGASSGGRPSGGPPRRGRFL